MHFKILKMMKYINVLFNALTPYDLYSDLNMYGGCNKVNFQAYFTFLILLCDKKIIHFNLLCKDFFI